MLILGTNSIKDTGYDVDNSVRMETNTYLVGAAKVTSTNRKIGSFSFWIKRTGSAGTTGGIVKVYQDANTYSLIGFDSNNKLNVLENNASGSAIVNLITNAVYRDQSAWYHILVAFDTTQGTDTNRVKLYVNGSQPSLGTATYPSQDTDLLFFSNTSGEKIEIGVNVDGAAGSYYLSEFLYTDGTALANTDTGEFDSDSPTIWKPIDLSSITLGNNGSWMEFGDSSNFGVATGKAFVANNLAATDQSLDSPTNNFCTYNAINPESQSNTQLAEGNLKVTNSGGDFYTRIGTMAVNKGKWYAEFKITQSSSGELIGIIDVDQAQSLLSDFYAHSQSRGYTYNWDGSKGNSGSTSAGYGDTYTTNAIIGIAMDLDNNKIYVRNDGTWQDSGDPTSGATGTGAMYSITDGYYYAFVTTMNDNGTDPVVSANFGSPPYANSSSVADANGYGAFEYAPPSGYLALCTKNLAEEG